MRPSIHLRATALAILSALMLTGAASAAEVRVMISGGLTAAYRALVPEFERSTGHKVLTAYGPSMGTTVNAIPIRLERGEPADVLIMVGYALDDLAKQGKVISDSRVELVKSPIGVAVKSGTPKPDISTADALKRALLAAKTIAYSDSASGVYVSTEMFGKLGIADAMKDKARKISGNACRRDRRARRRRDRFSAGQRIEAGGRHRHRRAAAGRAAEDHGVFRRDRQRFERARRRQGADQVPRLARCARRNRQERHGSDCHRRDELVAGITDRYCSPSFETATSRPPQDEVQLVETQQPHAEERASRASRSMGNKRRSSAMRHLCIPCCMASSTITASASTMVVHFQNSSGLRSISGVDDVER